MPRKKKGPGRGRPGSPLAPRIDASAEEIASAVLGARPRPTGQIAETQGHICEGRGKTVDYPETYHQDNQCTPCHLAHSIATP